MGLAWADATGPFGGDLYVALGNAIDTGGVAVPATGKIVRVDASGGVSGFADGLEHPARLAFGPDGDLVVAVSGGIVSIAASSLVQAPPPDAGAGTPPAARLGMEAAPNPMNPSTWILLDLPEETALRLEVFDVLGQRVAAFGEGLYGAGRHDVPWRGLDARGRPLSSGTYFVRAVGSTGKWGVVKVSIVR